MLDRTCDQARLWLLNVNNQTTSTVLHITGGCTLSLSNDRIALKEDVAIVTDIHFAGMAEFLGTHFISAEVRHFPFTDEVKALDWLKTG